MSMEAEIKSEITLPVEDVVFVLDHIAPNAVDLLRPGYPGGLRQNGQALASPAWGSNTLAVRTGHVRTTEGEHSEPIFETSSYVYSSSAESEAAFAGARNKNVYSRFTNPTVAVFEKRLAALERTEAAVATASGMSALLATFMTFLRNGDHVICSRSIFGATQTLLRGYFEKFGIVVDFVRLTDTSAWSRALRPETRLLFCESPSNPLLEVADLCALSALAKEVNALLVVDNTFCTPCGQNPILLGAHIVIHSVGKYIDGQGRCVGGAVVCSAPLADQLRMFMRCAGPSMSAHSAWIFLKGLETLHLRMQRYNESAEMVARWLAGHPGILKVHYTGLESHPQYLLAKRQQRYHGGVLSFVVKGSRLDAWRFTDSLQMISRTTNVGDTKTTITHPASTTHLKLSQEERDAAGVENGLLRLTIGLEDVQDIISDLDRGLALL